MTTAQDQIPPIAGALRDALHKTGDLMESTHLHSLGESGHEAASRLFASAPDLTSRLGSAPVDLRSLRMSTARRAHQLAHSIDEGADALAPRTSGGHRWRWRLLALALTGVAAVYLSRKLTHRKASVQGSIEPPVEIQHKEAIAGNSSTRTTPGKPADAGAVSPGSITDANGARAKKVETK